MNNRNLAPLAFMILAMSAGCRGQATVARFCAVGDSRATSPALIIDLASRTTIAPDSESSLGPVYVGDYVGFTGPFPLMVPSSGKLSTVPVAWQANGYRFRATAASWPNPDWILVHADPNSEFRPAMSRRSTTLLYSYREGVVAIKMSSELDGKIFDDQYYRCGETRLFLDRLLTK
jgi:hypothetical protein